MTISSPRLPAGWSLSRLDRVASVSARIGWKALTASEYLPEGYVFLSTPNIKGEEIDFENVNYISGFRYDESPELQLRLGDVLLVKDGNTLGVTNVVRHLPRPATVNGSIAVLRPSNIDPQFLRYTLASDFVQGIIGSYRAGMGVPHLFQADIKKFSLPMPPLPAQRVIADYLDIETARMDGLIEKKRHMIGLLYKRRQAAIDDAVLGHGRTAPVKHVVSRLTSGPRGWAEHAREEGSLFLRIANVSAHDIELDMGSTMRVRAPEGPERERTRVRVDDVLLSITADIGSVGVARQIHAGANVSQHIALLTPSGCSGDWLAYALSSSDAQAQLDASRYGGTKTQLALDDVAQVRIWLPPREEVPRRVSDLSWRISAIRIAQAKLRRQLDLLVEHRQALITAAVTGELAVPGVAA